MTAPPRLFLGRPVTNITGQKFQTKSVAIKVPECYTNSNKFGRSFDTNSSAYIQYIAKCITNAGLPRQVGFGKAAVFSYHRLSTSTVIQ